MENTNSVCYVGLIGEIIPIEGADNIELTLVGGWQAITKKGEYQVGDMVVVATTDAVIPVTLSDLMEVTNYLRKGQRVRTVKLRGVYSECLIIPLKYTFKSEIAINGFVEYPEIYTGVPFAIVAPVAFLTSKEINGTPTLDKISSSRSASD